MSGIHFFLDGMNFLFYVNKYTKKVFFSFLAAGFCPKNLAFARKKNVGFARLSSLEGGTDAETPEASGFEFLVSNSKFQVNNLPKEEINLCIVSTVFVMSD